MFFLFKDNAIWRRAIILLLWMSIIFSFSMMKGSSQAFDPPLWYFLERKGAHIFEYAVLFIFSVSFFKSVFLKQSLISIIALSIVFSMTYAVTDELHQFFVPYRGARMSDVLIDSFGIICMAVILFFFYRIKGKKP